jgi:hypothetical protein
MNIGRLTLLGSAFLVTQICISAGCSSTSDTTPSASGSPGTAGTASTGTGGSTGTSGSSSTGTGGAAPEVNCNSTNAKTGATCGVDCAIHCGFNQLGDKLCTCSGGFYTACPCSPPVGWQGAPTAPACEGTSTATAASLKGTACTTAYQECIGNDPITGTTPQGCACLDDPTNPGSLLWACGSTNKWFTLQ